MKKLVINLQKRSDRKDSFLKKNYFIDDVQFISGFDGYNLTLDHLNSLGYDTNKNFRDAFKNRKMTKGEVGCAISHMIAWTIVAQFNETAIIFEDDAIINQELWDEQYYSKLMETYDLLYLGRNENEPDKVKSINDVLEVPAYPYNLHAYIITPKAAKILLNTNFNKNIMPVDEYVPLILPHLNSAALKQDSVDQESRDVMGTDIEPISESDWFVDFKTHVVTVGTDRKKCIPVNDSAMHNNIYPVNLGTNVDWKGTDMSGPGGGMKVNLLREYLSDLPEHDVVLFTDAYDIFYADDLKTIVERYMGFQTNVLFAAEASCWPDESLSDQFPDGGTKYRFLNSGVFIGTVSELKKILADPLENDADDQLYYQQKFLSGEFDIKLDYEGYIFVTHENNIYIDNNQVFNPETNVYGCIYHGNGGTEEKNKFDALYRNLYPKSPSFFIPTYNMFDIIDNDMLVVNFMTQSQCEDLIDIADKHGGWGSLNYDKFPAQEIRMKELGMWEELEKHWQKNLYPIIESYWNPIEMYGLRDAFVMRYAMDTQTSLSYHHDASLVTGSVKLNDDYEGAELLFRRQNISNDDIAVGRCILFPGQVTHGHECLELKSGVKYSLTMWSSRYPGDIGG
jgi:glycosyl transferase family 25